MTKLLLKSRIMDGLKYFKSDQLNIYEAADGIMRLIEEYESNQVQAGVSDDFCGICGRKFEPTESKFYRGVSAVYGEYFPKSDKPICGECSERKYKDHIAEYESKNSR